MQIDNIYNLTFTPYRAGGNVEVDDRCNGFTVVNLGDDTALINGVPLFPSATPLTAIGDVLSIGGNEGELYKGVISLSFAGVGVAPQVMVIQKFFIKDYQAMRHNKNQN